jgi:uncharacterized protein (DUF2141 family)
MIRGKLFNDANGSGKRDAGDSSLGEMTVYLDDNANGVLDPGETAVQSGPDGAFVFTGLGAGTYHVAVDHPDGWRVTTTPPTRDVTLDGRKRAAKVKPIGLSQASLLGGTVYLDLTGDGARQDGEPGLKRWRVYIDQNGDGAYQQNEPAAKTDKTGTWAFRSLAPGTYTVRVIPQNNYTPTDPPDGVLTVTLAGGASMDTDNLFGEKPIL